MSWTTYCTAGLVTALVGLQVPQHRLRRVELDGHDKGIHALKITGAPHVTTTVRLPDSFSAANVSCGGDCVDARELDGERARPSGANWVIDLRPQERTLHLWPAALPSHDNPPSAFRSNVFVGLDGGEVISMELRLVDPAHPGEGADAVVDVVGGGAATYSGRIEAERAEAQRRAEEGAREVMQAQLRRQLSGLTTCHRVRWSRPHRSERAVVRLRQICATEGDDSLRWVVFTVENRAATPLPLGSVRLVPDVEDAGEGYVDRGYTTRDAMLPSGASTQGVAAVQLTGSALARTSWTLWLESEEPRQMQVRIGGINF